ncbi:MAG: 16S rRNA (cytidine(1402)-2'-O)-methyltransferase [Candidatus Omnitrophica bacterium]|nr:16S rRNA (cytidine(1402)-2'-O)-methyltransferase [Candidatus Omnitrophota bacterium]
MHKGTLYIVATPIGNLEDITLRAIGTLKAVDAIACEDTRHTGILLQHYDIHKPLISFYSYNQIKKVDFLICELNNGKNIALVSDAGTPGISDPGYTIIRAAINNDIGVSVIPGPSAAIACLAVSGKPTDKFIFEGFLSNKPSQRQKRLRELKDEERTIVIYESPHRILKLLDDIQEIMGGREVVCGRELTKKFEEVKRGTAADLKAYFAEKGPKGEFVVIL